MPDTGWPPGALLLGPAPALHPWLGCTCGSADGPGASGVLLPATVARLGWACHTSRQGDLLKCVALQSVPECPELISYVHSFERHGRLWLNMH